MIWLALGAALLAFFVWLGRNAGSGRGRDWRAAGAFVAVLGLVGGATFALRGAWVPALACLLVAVTVATLSQRSRAPRARREPPRLQMSAEEARGLLGVGPDAGEEEIQSAYVRLMRRVHPDAGGATGLAAQLNAARDRLMKERS